MRAGHFSCGIVEEGVKSWEESCISASAVAVSYHGSFPESLGVSFAIEIMSFFQNQQYEALPVEEKQELEELHQSIANARRKRILSIFAFVLIALSSLAFLGYVTTWQETAAVEVPVVEEQVPNEKTFVEHATRAVGDRYLLGVGRADITG